MTAAYAYETHDYDVVVVGAGGAGLRATLGTVFLVVAWLLAAATSADAFAVVNGLLTSIVGDILMTAAAWAIWYHVLGRLRHLIWDLGYGVNVKANETMGMIMFIGATVLTVVTVLVV